MKRTLAILAGTAILVASGTLTSRLTNRQASAAEIAGAVERLEDVPLVLGAWEGKDVDVLSERARRRAGAAGYLTRQYRHRTTGTVVSVYLACGRPGPLAVHTPDVCFGGEGYRLIQEPDKHPISANRLPQPAEFRVARFQREKGPATGQLVDLLDLERSRDLGSAGQPAHGFRRQSGPLQTLRLPLRSRAGEIDEGRAGRIPQAAAARAGGTQLGPMDFFLFLLLNATLFIRPAEVVPELEGLQIYLGLIIICLAASSLSLLRHLTLSSLVRQPISLCVLGLSVAVVLSHAIQFRLGDARDSGVEFLKVVAYYLLFVSVVSTPRRLEQFLYWLVGFTVVLTGLAVLQYHEVINLPALETLAVWEYDEESDEMVVLLRLVSTGIFNDPNDLCLILLIAMSACLYGLGDRRFGLLRWLWLAPLGFFGYAFTLTHSRGGFMALIAGAMVFVYGRFGPVKSIPLAVVGLPLLFVLFSGRQTSVNLSDQEDTAQQRIQLWSEGLASMREAPFFGIGQGGFVDEVGHAAHNSFLNCYTELGIFGGTLFLGTFFFALHGTHRLGFSDRGPQAPPHAP